MNLISSLSINVIVQYDTIHLSICVLLFSSMGRTSIDDGRITIPLIQLVSDFHEIRLYSMGDISFGESQSNE